MVWAEMINSLRPTSHFDLIDSNAKQTSKPLEKIKGNIEVRRTPFLKRFHAFFRTGL